MIERVLTIGAYGFDAISFVDALKKAGADLFVDVRARRGMRGAAYSFANSARLQASLADAGIPYVHAKELAPDPVVRHAQQTADARQRVAKRQRHCLCDEAVAAYRERCLSHFSAAAFVGSRTNGARRPVLFCVEREPAACHRSLVAERLSTELGVPVENLLPCGS